MQFLEIMYAIYLVTELQYIAGKKTLKIILKLIHIYTSAQGVKQIIINIVI